MQLVGHEALGVKRQRRGSDLERTFEAAVMQLMAKVATAMGMAT